MASLQTCPGGPLVIAPSNGDSRIDVSLVLPTYNEGKNIAAVIAQLVSDSRFGPESPIRNHRRR